MCLAMMLASGKLGAALGKSSQPVMQPGMFRIILRARENVK
jgi:hypothetical protein